jgi:hypothetical protein
MPFLQQIRHVFGGFSLNFFKITRATANFPRRLIKNDVLRRSPR